jgi:hypothetical protein
VSNTAIMNMYQDDMCALPFSLSTGLRTSQIKEGSSSVHVAVVKCPRVHCTAGRQHGINGTATAEDAIFLAPLHALLAWHLTCSRGYSCCDVARTHVAQLMHTTCHACQQLYSCLVRMHACCGRT